MVSFLLMIKSQTNVLEGGSRSCTMNQICSSCQLTHVLMRSDLVLLLMR